jgi:hypothetical protein
MVNNNSANRVTKAAISKDGLLYLLNTSGLKPAKISPLANMNGKPASPDFLKELQASGLTDATNNPTPACKEALTILANPAIEIDLLWGNPDSISLSKAYSAAGQDRFVAFTGADGKTNISFFLSAHDITELMTERLAFTEVKDVASINLEAAPAAAPVFFALLDIYRESQLKSALERRTETAVTATVEDVNRIIQEAKLENNFSWYAPGAYAALPFDSPITESTAEEGFRILKKEGVIGAGGELSSAMTTLAYRAFPIAGFFGIKILTSNGTSLEKTQLALFRGLSTLILAQLTTINGENRVQISTIPTAQLPEILFNLGTRVQETPAPSAPPTANTMVCGKCGTANSGTGKFCSKCGAPLATPAVARFCTKCGTPAAGGEKFCKKCGSPIK